MCLLNFGHVPIQRVAHPLNCCDVEVSGNHVREDGRRVHVEVIIILKWIQAQLIN